MIILTFLYLLTQIVFMLLMLSRSLNIQFNLAKYTFYTVFFVFTETSKIMIYPFKIANSRDYRFCKLLNLLHPEGGSIVYSIYLSIHLCLPINLWNGELGLGCYRAW